jgi:hypothetical protein
MGPPGPPNVAPGFIRLDVVEACSVVGHDGRPVAFGVGVQDVDTALAERLIAVGNAVIAAE